MPTDLENYLKQCAPVASPETRIGIQRLLLQGQNHVKTLEKHLARHNLPTPLRIHYARERRHFLANVRAIKSFLSSASSIPPHN